VKQVRIITTFKLLRLFYVSGQGIFTNAASDYDKVNDFASLGAHQIWRKRFIDRLAPANNTKLIDMATGTGNNNFQICQVLTIVLKAPQQFVFSSMSKTTN
jgi:hypothetical protein